LAPRKLLIRRATLADRASVLEIAATGMREFGLVPEFDGLDAALGQLGEGRPAAIAELVADEDGIVVGSVVVVEKGASVGKLTGFYVHPAHRGRGVGRALLAEAIRAAKLAGLRRLDLETWASMETAVQLYESFGWVLGSDPPPGSGADRSYWLELCAPNSPL